MLSVPTDSLVVQLEKGGVSSFGWSGIIAHGVTCVGSIIRPSVHFSTLVTSLYQHLRHLQRHRPRSIAVNLHRKCESCKNPSSVLLEFRRSLNASHTALRRPAAIRCLAVAPSRVEPRIVKSARPVNSANYNVVGNIRLAYWRGYVARIQPGHTRRLLPEAGRSITE